MPLKNIYLSGQIEGLEEKDMVQKFASKGNELKLMGYNVHNLLSIHITAGDKAKDKQRFMRERLRYLLACDELHLLPCWQSDKAAILERDMAMRLGMNIIYH